MICGRPELRSERMRLAPSDGEAPYLYRSHERVSRLQSLVPEYEPAAVQFIEQTRHTPFDTPGSWLQLGIRWHASDTLLGDAGVHTLEDVRQGELGVSIAPEHQPIGIAREALTCVLHMLLVTRSKPRVIA
jgi:RimJ/RimL family protein N-acetyltransferase